MHNIAKFINELCIPNVRAKIANPYNIKYNNPFCKEFANIYEINDNCIVIYPEIIFGNPLNATNVVRWILLALGSEMSVDHYKNWNKTNLVYHWESSCSPDKYYKQLALPWFNPLFKKTNFEERKETCFMIKKAPLFHKEYSIIHEKNAIEINDYSNHINQTYIEYVASIFNKCKYFYCYDPNSAFIIFAAICGCVPIVYPIQNVDKRTYLQDRIFNCGNECYDFIAYGDNENEIIHANKQINNIDNIISSMEKYYHQNVIKFIEDMKQFSLNTNRVCLKYMSLKYIYDYDVNKLYVYDNKSEIHLFEKYKSYFVENNIEYYDNYYILDNHEKYFQWLKYSLENGFVSIYSPFTNNKLTTDIYFLIDIEITLGVYCNKSSICNYYFEEENIVVGMGLGTVEPMQSRILYLISLNDGKIHFYGWDYDKNVFKNDIFDKITNIVEKMHTIDFTKIEKKKYNTLWNSRKYWT
jgi:hypothetical protein